MADYEPNMPFNVHAVLQVPEKKTVKGTMVKSYRKQDDIFVSFRTFGGTESQSNGAVIVENTAVIETWYRPDITADCRLDIEGCLYDIIGEPENINRRNQWLKFKVRAVKGGA